MKVLIIGGSGFIGRHTVHRLNSAHIPTVVYDRHADPLKSSSICTFIRGIISDSQLINQTIRDHQITHVVHTVSTTGPASSNKNKVFDVESNIVPILNLLKSCVRNNVQRFFFLSSGGTVYGVPNSLPISENHPKNPLCSYGVTKLAIEKYIKLYKHLYDLDYTIIRPSNPYGPGQNHSSGQGLIAAIVHKMHTNEVLEVWGDGSNVRDYFHVNDLSDLLLKSLSSSVTGTFNAGSSVGTSINGLIDTIALIGGLTPNIKYCEPRKLDVPSIVLDCNSAKESFAWHPSISLECGIEDYIRWYRANFL